MSKIPTLDETTAKIEELISQPGYFYALLRIARNDLFLPIDQFEKVDWWERLSYQELGYLMGLLVKTDIDLSVFPDKESRDQYTQQTYSLLEDLHHHYSYTGFETAVGPLLEKVSKGETIQSEQGPKLLESPEAIIESVFYSDSGAYDFQYWDVAGKRYREDDQWIIDNFGFSINDAVQTSIKIKHLSEIKANIQIEPHEGNLSDLDVLDVFKISKDDLEAFSAPELLVLEQLSVIPGSCNSSFKYISDFNELNIRPIVKLSASDFLVLNSFDVARTVDESPYYWMIDRDQAYFDNQATKHRGKYTEDATAEILRSVFGDNKVFTAVQVNRPSGEGIKKKGIHYTDIDVLALLGNKAIVVQCKSKKLTYLSIPCLIA